ncbi:hypothetical protein [Colwellia sp. RSH04]|uniref:hypothetical protein n=1 Tax=Colwellia sp. RSH04 TaxID=2305464 RepID=UPI000E588EE0|nr:hypothetical protein [Colwellia sp. RSH04]RHW77630.1 hypothetical protein D1094_01410 [Colwellia sp. RSH04]
MKLSFSLVNTIILTALLSNTAMATETPDKFKIAKIKKSAGFQSSTVKAYNDNMALCVSYLTDTTNSFSDKACTKAVSIIESINLDNNSKVNYFKSLSYSNRAISKYFQGDNKGALADLSNAILIDSNTITKSNFALIKELSLEENTLLETQSSEVSD